MQFGGTRAALVNFILEGQRVSLASFIRGTVAARGRAVRGGGGGGGGGGERERERRGVFPLRYYWVGAVVGVVEKGGGGWEGDGGGLGDRFNPRIPFGEVTETRKIPLVKKNPGRFLVNCWSRTLSRFHHNRLSFLLSFFYSFQMQQI